MHYMATIKQGYLEHTSDHFNTKLMTRYYDQIILYVILHKLRLRLFVFKTTSNYSKRMFFSE